VPGFNGEGVRVLSCWMFCGVGGSLAEGNMASEEVEEEESMAESPSRSGSAVRGEGGLEWRFWED
jgi:hypothetical protein